MKKGFLVSQNNLRKIKVSGFKSIKSLALDMKDINILVGANGAGKSNFVSLFTFLGKLSTGNLKQYIKTDGGAERFLHFGSRTTKMMSIEVNVDINKYYGTFTKNVDDDSLVIVNEHCEISTSNGIYPLDSTPNESGLSKVKGLVGVQQYTKKYLDSCRVYHFHDTSKHAGYKQTRELNSDYYLENDAGNIAPFLYALRNSNSEIYSRAYESIRQAIQSIAPFFDDFYLQPSGEGSEKNIILRWLQKDYSNPFSANVLSDGTARFICMATLFLQPKALRPDTIILDEPELGLHPAALVALADIIKSVSAETQIICSTQSITLANQFNVEDFIVVDAKDGVSTFERPDVDFLANWLDDYGMGDIWAKNLIGGRPQW